MAPRGVTPGEPSWPAGVWWGLVPATPPLSRFPPPLPWEVLPLGRLLADGRVAWEPGAWPPEGACRLVVWRPDARPQFWALEGRLRASPWRFEGALPGREAWVVLVLPP